MRRALYMDLEVGQSITMDGITIRLEDMSGRKAKLRIEADDSVNVEKIRPVGKTGAAQAKAGVAIA